jgi:hypothetical protein
MLRYYAEHNPKASTFAMLAATTLTCAVFVIAVDARDERLARIHNSKTTSLGSHSAQSTSLSPQEAKLSAMIENARNSSWRENLENAVDAHERFVLPNRNVDEGKEVPQYVRNIDERSRELLKEEEERREKMKDPERTWFWR